MVEVKDLYPIVSFLVLCGILLGVGILTFDRFGDAVKTPTDLNETIAMTAGVGATTYDELNSFTSAGNGTFLVTTFNGAGGAVLNWTEPGAVHMNNTVTGNIWVVYNYDADSKATDAMDDVGSAAASISSNWLTLIVTVICLAIIMGLVIRSFGGGKTRE